MYFIEKKDEFNEVKKSISELVDITKRIPDDPFILSKLKNNMVFLDPYSFDYHRPYLFRMLKSLLKSTSSSECIVMVTDDPSNPYHFDSFDSFPAFVFSTNDSERDIDNALNKEIGPNNDFSLMLGITQHFVIFPRNKQWVIIADRSFDIAIAGFKNRAEMELFREFDEGVCYDNFDDVMTFFQRLEKKPTSLKKFYDNFLVWK